MGLSQWPKPNKPDVFANEPKGKMVTVTLDAEMYVAVVTSKAVGLAVDIATDVEIWLPRSQISDAPNQGSWVGTIVMPQWLADEKGLEYQ